jgi:hypothetical protein
VRAFLQAPQAIFSDSTANQGECLHGSIANSLACPLFLWVHHFSGADIVSATYLLQPSLQFRTLLLPVHSVALDQTWDAENRRSLCQRTNIRAHTGQSTIPQHNTGSDRTAIISSILFPHLALLGLYLGAVQFADGEAVAVRIPTSHLHSLSLHTSVCNG